MSDRLATVERVLSVNPHPNADRLDIIKVLGYDCIVGRDQYREGECIIFIQPDSLLPTDREWAAPLLRYTSRGRIRAVRLRGEWSMGLVCDLHTGASQPEGWEVDEGEDMTEELGLTKFEPALPNNTQARGLLPFAIPKTDEERWQNIRDMPYGEPVDVTLKIDGQSFTAYVMHDQTGSDPLGQRGITSRSLDLKMGEGFNSNWHEVERKYDVLNKLTDYCQKHNVCLALRGEVYGTGIQAFESNPHAKMERDVAFYSVYDIKAHRYIDPGEEHDVFRVCKELDLPTVPAPEAGVPLTPELIQKYDSQLEELYGVPFEGVVVRGKGFSFKIINKHYDMRK